MAGFIGMREGERTALFIDGANLYKAARGLGFDLDYKSLLSRTRESCQLVRAYYYTSIVEDRTQDYSPLRPLVDWLDYNGYTMVTKVSREYTDAQGRKRFKGGVDIELVVDMLVQAPRLDHIILFSGNGDFRRAVEAVQAMGVRVTVVSTVKAQPPMAADELRRQADSFVDLADLEAQVGRAGGGAQRRGRGPVTADDGFVDDDYEYDEEDDLEDVD